MSKIDINNHNLIKREVIGEDIRLVELNWDTKDEDISPVDILITYSDYNSIINLSLLNGFINELNSSKFTGTIAVLKIPGGAFELPLLSEYAIKHYQPKIASLIGCIIKGDTMHYEFLSSSVINATRNLSVSLKLPVINGVLTVEKDEHALDRAGLKLNKGREFAQTSLDILSFIKKYSNE